MTLAKNRIHSQLQACSSFIYALTVIWLSLVLTGCSEQVKDTPVLTSQTEVIQYRINGEAAEWTVSPEVSPDRLVIECEAVMNNVVFTTGIDSVQFQIKEGDTARFHVLLNGDSALTEIVGIAKNVNFSDEYIQANKGTVSVTIPEVHELIYIVGAISDIGKIDTILIDHNTEYYQKVLAHFEPYKDHALIALVNDNITAPMHEQSYLYFYGMKMNACGYLFSNDGSIVDDGIIHRMGFHFLKDPIKENKELYEDFARTSGFRSFFEEHQDYYESLVGLYNDLIPIDDMNHWLESKFKMSYGSYKITFSPLTYGLHSTEQYEDNGFEQTVMYVRRPKMLEEHPYNVNEMLESLVVFTEIDHGFANPFLEPYHKSIEEALSSQDLWVTRNDVNTIYSTSFDLFAEYFTWSLFSLYCLDQFDSTDYDIFEPMVTRQMVDRGFIRYGEFNSRLVALYRENPDADMTELTDKIIEWCAEVNNQDLD
mgnify:CR=1 FL=1